MQDKLAQVLAKLGKSPVFTSGDAADYMGRACYRMGDGKTTIEFYEFELGAGFLLRYTKSSDYAKCALLKGPKANEHVEINGLELGISKSEIRKILGKPTKRTPNKWTYDLHGTARDNNLVEQSIYHTSGWDKKYPYYWDFLIQVGFKGSAVSSLDLMPYTQQ